MFISYSFYNNVMVQLQMENMQKITSIVLVAAITMIMIVIQTVW